MATGGVRADHRIHMDNIDNKGIHMRRALAHSLFIIAASVALAGAATADDVLPAPSSAQAQARPGDASLPTGTPLPVMGAEQPRQISPSEVRGHRDERLPCDPRQPGGQETCRAQLAAKYADMDRLCRIASSGSELPVCIRSAYAAE